MKRARRGLACACVERVGAWARLRSHAVSEVRAKRMRGGVGSLAPARRERAKRMRGVEGAAIRDSWGYFLAVGAVALFAASASAQQRKPVSVPL